MIERQAISDDSDDDAYYRNMTGTNRIQIIDNTSVQDYYGSNVFQYSRTFRYFPEIDNYGNNCGNLYEKIASRKATGIDLKIEKQYFANNTSNLANLILALDPGDSTPTYDEPQS